MSGIMSATGSDGGAPVKVGVPITDLGAGLFAVVGMVITDRRRRRELGDAEKRTLEAEIAKMTGKKVRAQYGLDASLLGGAVVRIGSTIYDGSVKGQLERIKEAISS